MIVDILKLSEKPKYLYSGSVILAFPLDLPDGFFDKYSFLDETANAFGLDVFGNVFLEKRGESYLLNIETGDAELISPSLESFYLALEEDSDYLSGVGLLRKWERKYGPLPKDYRLMPAVPFFLGGEYAVDNIKSAPTMQVLSLFSDLHEKTRDVPDGTPIEISFFD